MSRRARSYDAGVETSDEAFGSRIEFSSRYADPVLLIEGLLTELDADPSVLSRAAAAQAKS